MQFGNVSRYSELPHSNKKNTLFKRIAGFDIFFVKLYNYGILFEHKYIWYGKEKY